jgi:ABC-type sugar transport system ATPase subunit
MARIRLEQLVKTFGNTITAVAGINLDIHDLTVFENIAFGLRVQKVADAEIRQRVTRAAATFRIAHLLPKKPGQCSGGEAQRVALARTTITNPDVLLLDEPLSSLDAKLRIEMRTELKRLHKHLGSTFVYVTHDQAEAMTMADRSTVMRVGHIQQLGTPLVAKVDGNREFKSGDHIRFVCNPQGIHFFDTHDGTRF